MVKLAWGYLPYFLACFVGRARPADPRSLRGGVT
jgi:hypothetical protein